MLDFEGDSIRLAITAKRHRRKPIDPEASQFEDSIGVFSPDGTLNCWVCMKCSTRRELPGTGRINAHARSCIGSIRIAKPEADASASRRWAIASRSKDSKNSRAEIAN